MPPQEIVSAKNPLVKKARRLARPRKKEGSLLLEGAKLVETALAAGFELEALLLASDLPEAKRARFRTLEPVLVSPRTFREIGTLETPDGVAALVKRPSRAGPDLPRSGLLAVAVGVQDPGNLGAVARVAEAAGATALVAVKGTTDPFGPKAIRGSMGSLLRLPVFEVDALEPIQERGFRLAALVPRNGDDFRDVDWRPPVAALFGGEGRGLDDDALARADLRVTIPMKGGVESLNVATAAALVLYEAARRAD